MGDKDNKAVTNEELCSALIRQFLSRKGLRGTLAQLEKELPRTPASISNAVVLAETLNINQLVEANKKSEFPYQTLLEVIVQSLIEALHVAPPPPCDTARDGVPAAGRRKLNAASASDTATNTSVPRSRLRQAADDNPITSHSHRPDFSKRISGNKPVRHPSISSTHRDMSSTKGHGTAAAMRRHDPAAGGAAKAKARASQKQKLTPSNVDALTFSPKDMTGKDSALHDAFPEHGQKKSPQHSGDENEIRTKLQSKDQKGHDADFMSNSDLHSSLSKPAMEKEPGGMGLRREMSMKCEDLEDMDLSISAPVGGANQASYKVKFPSGTRISSDDTKALRKVLFGAVKAGFNKEWEGQDLHFSEVPDLGYGLIQHKGGPCGALAALQAHILKHLLFQGSPIKFTEGTNPRPTTGERNKALVSAMVEILWKAGGGRRAAVTLPAKTGAVSKGFGKTDILDKLDLFYFKDRTELLSFMEYHLVHQFMDSSGCILLTVSTVFSRGIAQVHSDMDEPSSHLIGAHGYCTQELVNLMLVGVAASNVFDGTMNLGSGGESHILKGINVASDIGFLSLFEHYGSCEVGSHYKNPTYPIFVVCSESHFLVVFSTVKDLIKKKNVKTFDIFYYDGLARQKECIRLTLDTSNKGVKDKDGDLVPPIELCLRTKWKGCPVNWNGTEKLL